MVTVKHLRDGDGVQSEYAVDDAAAWAANLRA